MSNFRSQICALRRPSMLIRAARLGQSDYRRERDLKRLIAAPNAWDEVIPQLLKHEHEIEQIRLRGEIGYSAARHIELLIALMAEAQRLPVEKQPG